MSEYSPVPSNIKPSALIPYFCCLMVASWAGLGWAGLGWAAGGGPGESEIHPNFKLSSH